MLEYLYGKRFGSSQTFSHINTPTFSNLDILLTYPPMKTERTECTEMSAHKIQTPGNYPEEKAYKIQNTAKVWNQEYKQLTCPCSCNVHMNCMTLKLSHYNSQSASTGLIPNALEIDHQTMCYLCWIMWLEAKSGKTGPVSFLQFVKETWSEMNLQRC